MLMTFGRRGTQIKVCGVRRFVDAKWCYENGADYLGMIFYSKSPRQVSDHIAKKIGRFFSGKIPLVGVFVKKSINDIVDLKNRMNLSMVQLHGDYTHQEISQLSSISGVSVLPVCRFQIAHQVRDYMDYPQVLIDTWTQKYGGSGEVCNLKELKKFLKEYQGTVFLAGGMNPFNIKRVLKDISINVVDISSGLEKFKGEKSIWKVKAFFDQLR